MKFRFRQTMKSCIFLSLCCVLVISRWASSQEIDDCLTGKAHKGKCVSIANCPSLLRIAQSPVISESDKLKLREHVCGNRKVCCRSPLQVTTTSTTTESYSYDDVEESQPTNQPLLPKENDCGLDTASQRIIGGDITDKEQFRWTVALDYKHPRTGGVKCGGSLINTRYVLTAAHCVFRVQKQDLTLRLGEWDIEQNPDCEEEDEEDCNPEVRIVRVSQILIHPNYKDKTNDIALLRMEQALPDEYTSHILPICMPLSTELMQDAFTNRNVSVVGWGKNEKETRSRFKMFAELITINNQRCEQALEKPLHDTQMCAQSFTETIRDTCGGDSGGPLQIQIKGTYYLVGIVSHGPPCGKTLLPAVYTRVTSFLDWILENITD